MLHHCIHCLIPSWGFCFYFGFKTLFFCLFIGILNNNSLVSLHSHYFGPNIILLYYLKHISVAPCIHFWKMIEIFSNFIFFSSSPSLNFLLRFLVNEKFNKVGVLASNQVESWVLVILQHMCILIAIHCLTHTHVILLFKIPQTAFIHSFAMFHVSPEFLWKIRLNSFECPGII